MGGPLGMAPGDVGAHNRGFPAAGSAPLGMAPGDVGAHKGRPYGNSKRRELAAAALNCVIPVLIQTTCQI